MHPLVSRLVAHTSTAKYPISTPQYREELGSWPTGKTFPEFLNLFFKRRNPEDNPHVAIPVVKKLSHNHFVVLYRKSHGDVSISAHIVRVDTEEQLNSYESMFKHTKYADNIRKVRNGVAPVKMFDSPMGNISSLFEEPTTDSSWDSYGSYLASGRRLVDSPTIQRQLPEGLKTYCGTKTLYLSSTNVDRTLFLIGVTDLLQQVYESCGDMYNEEDLRAVAKFFGSGRVTTMKQWALGSGMNYGSNQISSSHSVYRHTLPILRDLGYHLLKLGMDSSPKQQEFIREYPLLWDSFTDEGYYAGNDLSFGLISGLQGVRSRPHHISIGKLTPRRASGHIPIGGAIKINPEYIVKHIRTNYPGHTLMSLKKTDGTAYPVLLIAPENLIKSTGPEDNKSYFLEGMESSFGLAKCGKCKTYHHIGGTHRGICFPCLGVTDNNIHQRISKLHPYNTKATAFFRGKFDLKKPQFTPKVFKSFFENNGGNVPTMLGIELEILLRQKEGGTLRDGAAKTMRTDISIGLKDHAILKHDGSLASGGVEICTRPASYEVHRDSFKNLFRYLEEHKDNLPGKVIIDGSCGMHVHVDRAQLTPLQIGKIHVFINGSNNKTFISSIAKRYHVDYARLSPYPVVGHGNRARFIRHMSQQGANIKYAMLNLGRTDTIEFRLFSGTFDYNQIVSNMEFCKALVDWTTPGRSTIHLGSNKQDTISTDLHNPTAFKQFVNDNSKDYPFLVKQNPTQFKQSNKSTKGIK